MITAGLAVGLAWTAAAAGFTPKQAAAAFAGRVTAATVGERMLRELRRSPLGEAYASLYDSGALRIKTYEADQPGSFARFGSYQEPDVVYLNDVELTLTARELVRTGVSERELLAAVARDWLPNLVHETEHKVHYDALRRLLGSDYPPYVIEDEVAAYAAQCAWMRQARPKARPVTTRAVRNARVMTTCEAGMEKLRSFVLDGYSVGSLDLPQTHAEEAARARRRFEELASRPAPTAAYGQGQDKQVPGAPAATDRRSRDAAYFRGLAEFWERPESVAKARAYFAQRLQELAAP